MKLRFLAILVLGMSTSVAFSQGIEFHHGDLASVFARAKEEQKLIFVDAFTTWCGPCKWMAANTFPDEKVGALYNEKFVAYKFDMEKGEGIEFRKKYDVRAFPTLLYLNADGEVVHRLSGAMGPEDFIQLGEAALDPEKSLSGMQALYEGGKRDPEFIRAYLNTLTMAMMEKPEVLDQYLVSQSQEELLTKENFELINNQVSDPFDEKFKIILDNKDAYVKAVGAENYDPMVYDKFKRSLYYAKRKGQEEFDSKVAAIKELGYDQGDKLVQDLNVLMLFQQQDWAAFAPAATSFLEKYPDPAICNQYAWKFYEDESITDEKLLKEALKWSELSLKSHKMYMNTDTYAALLYKIGRTKDAKKAAEEAIALGKKEGVDVSGTEELMAKYSK